MMKTPLFFLFSVFLICILSGCEKTYYHHENSFSYLKGKVKKITDTVYAIVPTGEDSQLPIQTVEYHFDTVNRLTEQKSCTFRLVESDLFDEGYDTVLYSVQHIRHRYDQNGRRVETLTEENLFQNDTSMTSRVAMKLVGLDKNHEKWERASSNNLSDGTTHWNMDVYYSKDTSTVVLADAQGTEKNRSLSIFDPARNLLETREIKGDTSETWAKYQYDSNHLLTGISQKAIGSSDKVFSTSYRHEEYDGEGNWLKRLEYDADGKLINVIQRRIEYGN